MSVRLPRDGHSTGSEVYALDVFDIGCGRKGVTSAAPPAAETAGSAAVPASASSATTGRIVPAITAHAQASILVRITPSIPATSPAFFLGTAFTSGKTGTA